MLEGSTIAAVVKNINTLLIIVLALFAAFGGIAIFSKKLRANAILFGFSIAALAAFALEATAFNFPHYLKYFAGPQTAIMGRSTTDPNVLLTTDGTYAEFTENGIHFSNLNRKVTSIFVNVDFYAAETGVMLIQWTDGDTRQYEKTLYKYLPHENYAPLQPRGNVSDITTMFSYGIGIREIVINKPIPLYFSGLRLLVNSFLLFAFFSFVNKSLRAKMAYYLFESKFDVENKKQNIVYACAVAVLVLFSWFCVYTSSFNDEIEKESRPLQYNKFLVDALISGRTYLDDGNPEILLNAERPYDRKWREANGYDYNFDWVWYKGKYYTYYGLVPAILLYVPYKLITGDYLSNAAGVFLFSAIAVILLALLWRHCVLKYMRDIRYAFYLLSFITLFFASGISGALRFPTVHTLMQSAGFMFFVAGVLLLFKSTDNEKINYPKLFFACLCFALIFGSRPNLGLASSLLVPVVLWKRRSWKLVLFVLIPYILVAIPLCLYNYVRFGSIFEFGGTYVLTGTDTGVAGQLNLLGKILMVFVVSAYSLFCPNVFTLEFPFVQPPQMVFESVTLGVVWLRGGTNAIINYPIVFCLIYLFKNTFNKNRPKTFYVLSAFLIIGVASTAIYFGGGVLVRYALDFATFIILPSLFCAYYWCQRSTSIASKNHLTVTYALMAVSIFVGLFMFVFSENNFRYDPTLYRYLEYSLTLFRKA